MDSRYHRGELTALLGTNGTGKSTLLRTMSATQPYFGGNIRLNGRELSSYNERELALPHRSRLYRTLYGRRTRVRTGRFGPLSLHRLFRSSRRQRPPYHRSGHGAKLASPTNRTLTSRNFLTEKGKKPSSPKLWHRKVMSYCSMNRPRFSIFPAVSKPCLCYIDWPKKAGKRFLCRRTM